MQAVLAETHVGAHAWEVLQEAAERRVVRGCPVELGNAEAAVAVVTTIGVDPLHQGLGLGELLLLCMFDEAVARGANWLTLEVRVTNWRAQRLYARFGFRPVGIRRNYYAELHEDALIMWTDDIREGAYRTRLDAIVSSLPDGIRPA